MSGETSPTVSCVTVFYNRAPYVVPSVTSLLNQTAKDIEVIAVDDGSTDATASELARLDDPRLRVVRQANTGFTVAINAAIALARAPYIAVHGAGDVSFPRRIEQQRKLLDSDGLIGAVGCVRDVAGHISGSLHAVERGQMRDAMLTRNRFSHGEVMFRKSIFDQVGGYRPAFRYAQDRDLWLRMGRHCDYAIVPELLYRQHFFPGSVTMSARHRFLQTKLSQFAVQCALSIDERGRDLLDRFGPSAFYLTEPTPELARKYALWGLRALRDGNEDAMDLFLRAAWREDRTIYTGMCKVMHSLAKTGLAAPQRALLRAMTSKQSAASQAISWAVPAAEPVRL